MAQLTHLILDDNQIGDAGITALAAACGRGGQADPPPGTHVRGTQRCPAILRAPLGRGPRYRQCARVLPPYTPTRASQARNAYLPLQRGPFERGPFSYTPRQEKDAEEEEDEGTGVDEAEEDDA